MKVTVKLFSYLINQAGFSQKEIELPAPVTIQELLEIIQIKPSLAKIILRNGQPARPDDLVEDGDRLVISPIFSGG
ncbi:MoaD/ThiS family protein [Candidatus Aminicenantes bacterium AC-334-K16]|jgi:sulfur carrier protein ThiS|nr:MoaD/ThiS family protein [Candidatus Aminicenantes bacterium AC-334-K16]